MTLVLLLACVLSVRGWGRAVGIAHRHAHTMVLPGRNHTWLVLVQEIKMREELQRLGEVLNTLACLVGKPGEREPEGFLSSDSKILCWPYAETSSVCAVSSRMYLQRLKCCACTYSHWKQRSNALATTPCSS